MKKRWDEPYLKKTKYNDRIRLKTGTFLYAYCPHCGKSLIEDNGRVELQNQIRSSSGGD